MLHIWLMWFSKLNLQSISIPNSLSQSLFLICDVPIFTCTFSPELISKWHLLAFPFNSFLMNHWNRFEKCGPFSDFLCDFRSSRSTEDLLTVVSDRIARAFNRSGATRAVALDISKAFDRVWHAGVLHHKLKSYGISCQIFAVITSFLSDRQLRVVLDGKSSQEYPVKVPQGSILGPTLLILYINDLPDDGISNIAIFADELASEIESDLWDTMDWGRKWLVDCNAGKSQLVLFERSNNIGATVWKWMGLFLRKNHLSRCWGWVSFLNWIGALTLFLC